MRFRNNPHFVRSNRLFGVVPKWLTIFFLAACLAAISILLAWVLWSESFYFDKMPMLSPIEYAGGLTIRNDWRGKGDFGTRRSGKRKHQGIDLLAPIGTPIRAAKGGIAAAMENKKGMGKFICIKHKNNLVTIYGHLSKINVKSAQRVRQGEIIGEVGNTGNASYNGVEPHLHFEVRVSGVSRDPKEYLCR